MLMKKVLKKITVVVLAVICAVSIHFSVSAAGFSEKPDWMNESVWSLLQQVLGTTEPNNEEPTTAAPNPDETTAPTTDVTTSGNPVIDSGTGTVTTETTEPLPAYVYPNSEPQQTPVFTTEPTAALSTTLPAEEDSSDLFSESLSKLLEQDQSHILIVEKPTESFTIGASIVKPNESDSGFTWQSAALVAALVLFVVLLALIVALLIQRGKRAKAEESSIRLSKESDASSEPVPVEVMSPERIAELLGSAGKTSASVLNMSSEDSAAAIKAAALMGQLTHSYSDPLIRKYTDEPVMISPVAKLDIDSGNVTAAQILEATDSMLHDFSDDYLSAPRSDKHISADEYNASLDAEGVTVKVCPECGKPVSSDDVFCHGCGAYVG